MTHVFYRHPDKLPYRDGDPVEADDYHYIASLESEVPGEVFRQMNCVDGTELCCALGVRSMSPGDIALTEEAAFLCCPVGWQRVGDTAFEWTLHGKAEQAKIEDEDEGEVDDD